MKYMTAQEAAEKGDITERWVQKLCKENRVKGAVDKRKRRMKDEQ